MPLNVLLYYSPRNLGTHPIHSCLLFPQWVIHTALVIYESSESSPYMDRLRHCQSVPWAIIELLFLELDCSQVNQKYSQAGQMGADGSLNTSDHPATKPPVDTRRLCKKHFEEGIEGTNGSFNPTLEQSYHLSIACSQVLNLSCCGWYVQLDIPILQRTHSMMSIT